ncbi:carbonic anhydrase 2-like isoform X2 [Ornithodoros turicata]|uniref:carbonic anhydrase 2-like isoform X2 n=1 Tax=Ornithodoros turicata TaxID=34597 RepID=UPI003138F7E9
MHGGEFIKCWHYKHAGSKHQGAASWPTQSCIENNHCGGTRQSPIDIETTKAVQDQSLPKLTFKNFDAPMTEWELMNNGHSAAFKPGKDDKTERTVSGGLLHGTYVFTQFHFHWGSKNTQGSEHLVDSKASVMEMHMVFMNKKYDTADKAVHNTDGIAVLATFFQVGTNSRGLDTLAAHLSEITTPGNIYKGLPAEKVSLLDLLPTNTNDFYTYEGSLTTPPCWEAVTWTVFRERSEIKQSQLDGYRKLNDMEDIHISNNYRPPQAMNGRVVKTTFAP